MRKKGSTPGYQLQRDWNAVYLPVLNANLDLLEDEWMQYALHPAIRGHYPEETWSRAREITDRARAAMKELAQLHSIDLEADEPPAKPTTPLWLLAGPKNPDRQRAESLRLRLDEDIEFLQQIVDAVSEDDQKKAIEDEIYAQDLQQAIEMEREDADAIKKARAERESWKARAALLPNVSSAASVFEEADQRAIQQALADFENALASLEALCADEDTYDDTFGKADEHGVTGLARLRAIVPETRQTIQDIAAALGLTVPLATVPRFPRPLEWTADVSDYAARLGKRAGSDPAAQWLFVALTLLSSSLAEIKLTKDWTPHLYDDDLARLPELAHLLDRNKGAQHEEHLS